MTIPYEQLSPSTNAVPRSSYMRLPSYQALRRRRYHPYRTARTRPLFSTMNMMELAEEADFEADMLLAHVNAIPVSFSLSMIPEDDCVAGLRTVVSQMIGRDSPQMCLGFVHLVIDFALILRSHRERGPAAVRNEAAMTPPPTTIAM